MSNANFEPSVFYYRCGIDLLEKPELILERDIIDAGAYIGDSSIVLSEYTNKKEYAFEALQQNFLRIEETCRINNRNNIIPVNSALGAQEGVLAFYIREFGETGHGLLKRDGVTYKKEEKVNVTTIDNYVNNNQLKVGLIKSDVEGAERDLIRGARETICKYKPALLISIYHTADDFFEVKTMIEELNCGYEFKIMQPITEKNVFLETMLVCEVK